MRQLYALTAAAVLVAALACTPAADEAAAPGDAGTEPGPYTIAVVPKSTAYQFWLTVKAGAEAAGDDHGAEIVWKGPPAETDVVEQMNIIEDMMNRGVDAIVMAATDQDALVDVVEQADERGIPVVTIDSGLNSDVPVSFVATDNVAGARTAADTLAQLIGEEGVVGLIPFVPGAATSEMRERGFLEGMEQYANIEVLEPQYSQGAVEIAMDVMNDMLTAHPELDGVFAANEGSAIGAAQALEVTGKAGDVKLVAFDASDDQIAALERGTIQALIVQNPFRMGYEGVKAAIDHLEGKDVPARIDTGVSVVTVRNLQTPEVQDLLDPEGA